MVQHPRSARDNAKGETRVDQIEGGGRKPGVECVSFNIPDVIQEIHLGPFARDIELPGIHVQTNHFTVQTDPATQQVGNAADAAAKVQATPTRLHADLVEHRGRVFAKQIGLHP